MCNHSHAQGKRTCSSYLATMSVSVVPWKGRVWKNAARAKQWPSDLWPRDCLPHSGCFACADLHRSHNKPQWAWGHWVLPWTHTRSSATEALGALVPLPAAWPQAEQESDTTKQPRLVQVPSSGTHDSLPTGTCACRKQLNLQWAKCWTLIFAFVTHVDAHNRWGVRSAWISPSPSTNISSRLGNSLEATNQNNGATQNEPCACCNWRTRELSFRHASN